jgi:hypothetical protein
LGNDGEVYVINRKGKLRNQDSDSGFFPNRLRTALKDQETDQGNFQVFNEAKLRSGALVRAFPNYRGQGPWYDWVNIIWVDSHGGNVFLPAKTLCFYESDKDGMCALVHSTVVQHNQNHDSMLSCSYEMEYSGLKPTISKVQIGRIDRTLIVYEHMPTKGCLPPDLDRRQQQPLRVLVVKPRNAWAEICIKWNRLLRDKNDNREEEGKGFYLLHTRIWTYSNLSDGTESNRNIYLLVFKFNLFVIQSHRESPLHNTKDDSFSIQQEGAFHSAGVILPMMGGTTRNDYLCCAIIPPQVLI